MQQGVCSVMCSVCVFVSWSLHARFPKEHCMNCPDELAKHSHWFNGEFAQSTRTKHTPSCLCAASTIVEQLQERWFGEFGVSRLQSNEERHRKRKSSKAFVHVQKAICSLRLCDSLDHQCLQFVGCASTRLDWGSWIPSPNPGSRMTSPMPRHSPTHFSPDPGFDVTALEPCWFHFATNQFFNV